MKNAPLFHVDAVRYSENHIVPICTVRDLQSCLPGRIKAVLNLADTFESQVDKYANTKDGVEETPIARFLSLLDRLDECGSDSYAAHIEYQGKTACSCAYEGRTSDEIAEKLGGLERQMPHDETIKGIRALQSEVPEELWTQLDVEERLKKAQQVFETVAKMQRLFIKHAEECLQAAKTAEEEKVDDLVQTTVIEVK